MSWILFLTPWLLLLGAAFLTILLIDGSTRIRLMWLPLVGALAILIVQYSHATPGQKLIAGSLLLLYAVKSTVLLKNAQKGYHKWLLQQ